jgi:hypothetical protein
MRSRGGLRGSASAESHTNTRCNCCCHDGFLIVICSSNTTVKPHRQEKNAKELTFFTGWKFMLQCVATRNYYYVNVCRQLELTYWHAKGLQLYKDEMRSKKVTQWNSRISYYVEAMYLIFLSSLSNAKVQLHGFRIEKKPQRRPRLIQRTFVANLMFKLTWFTPSHQFGMLQARYDTHLDVQQETIWLFARSTRNY